MRAAWHEEGGPWVMSGPLHHPTQGTWLQILVQWLQPSTSLATSRGLGMTLEEAGGSWENQPSDARLQPQRCHPR